MDGLTHPVVCVDQTGLAGLFVPVDGLTHPVVCVDQTGLSGLFVPVDGLTHPVVCVDQTGFSDLFVPVEGFPKGLQESLHSTFCSPEVLTGSNRYKCPVCKTHEDAVRVSPWTLCVCVCFCLSLSLSFCVSSLFCCCLYC